MYNLEQLPFEYFSAPDITALSDRHRELVLKAREASMQAYAPYSMFRVGVAAQLESGSVVLAGNTENAAFSACMCAERSALFQCRDRFPGHRVEALSITANPAAFHLGQPVTPCGTCRQVMAEFERIQERDIEVILSAQSGPVFILKNTRMLLPLHFHLDELKR